MSLATPIDRRTAVADFSERVAVCASAACLVHCLVLPVLLLMLPSLAAVLDIPESFHLWVLGLAVPTAMAALVLGWRRHRVIGPMLAGIAGLILLAIGALVVGETAWEVPVTIAGSLTLTAAHVINWRLRHRHRCDCDC